MQGIRHRLNTQSPSPPPAPPARSQRAQRQARLRARRITTSPPSPSQRAQRQARLRAPSPSLPLPPTPPSPLQQARRPARRQPRPTAPSSPSLFRLPASWSTLHFWLMRFREVLPPLAFLAMMLQVQNFHGNLIEMQREISNLRRTVREALLRRRELTYYG